MLGGNLAPTHEKVKILNILWGGGEAVAPFLALCQDCTRIYNKKIWLHTSLSSLWLVQQIVIIVSTDFTLYNVSKGGMMEFIKVQQTKDKSV